MADQLTIAEEKNIQPPDIPSSPSPSSSGSESSASVQYMFGLGKIIEEVGASVGEQTGTYINISLDG